MNEKYAADAGSVFFLHIFGKIFRIGQFSCIWSGYGAGLEQVVCYTGNNSKNRDLFFSF